jgi:hypothetical protein
MLGAFAAAPPASIVRPAQRTAVLGLLLMALTGSVLFTAEASHVAMNRVFQIKAGLIALGVLNALLVARPLAAVLDEAPAFQPLPGRLRLAAAISLLIWVSVAACGRLIAYF